MKLQQQTKFGGEDAPIEKRGNCFAACLASIVGVDLDTVPNFCALGDTWMERANAWLGERGLMLMSFNSDPSKRFYYLLRYVPQTFFAGTRTDYNVTLGLRPNSRFALEARYVRNDVKLPGGVFEVNLGILRLDYAVSPRTTIRSLIQYNSATNQVNTSVANPPSRSTTHSSQPMEKIEVAPSNVPIAPHNKANTMQAAAMASQTTWRMRGSFNCPRPLVNAFIMFMALFRFNRLKSRSVVTGGSPLYSYRPIISIPLTQEKPNNVSGLFFPTLKPSEIRVWRQPRNQVGGRGYF